MGRSAGPCLSFPLTVRGATPGDITHDRVGIGIARAPDLKPPRIAALLHYGGDWRAKARADGAGGFNGFGYWVLSRNS
jgi:hypothetical protein